MSAEPQGFEAKLTSLHSKNPQGLRAHIELFLLELVRFLTCCCCYQCRKPFGFTKPNKREGWSAHRAASCPAQLKVSTVDKRTIGKDQPIAFPRYFFQCSRQCKHSLGSQNAVLNKQVSVLQRSRSLMQKTRACPRSCTRLMYSCSS